MQCAGLDAVWEEEQLMLMPRYGAIGVVV